jgi:hypothetical protein
LLRSKNDRRYRSVRGGSSLQSKRLMRAFSLIPVGFVNESSETYECAVPAASFSPSPWTTRVGSSIADGADILDKQRGGMEGARRSSTGLNIYIYTQI